MTSVLKQPHCLRLLDQNLAWSWSCSSWPEWSVPVSILLERSPLTLETTEQPLSPNSRTDGRTASSDSVEPTGCVRFPLCTGTTNFPGRTGRPPDEACRLYFGTLSSPVIVVPRLTTGLKTPDMGVYVQSSSAIKQTPDPRPSRSTVQPLGWLRTMIEYDRSLHHQWPVDCSGICVDHIWRRDAQEHPSRMGHRFFRLARPLSPSSDTLPQ